MAFIWFIFCFLSKCTLRTQGEQLNSQSSAWCGSLLLFIFPYNLKYIFCWQTKKVGYPTFYYYKYCEYKFSIVDGPITITNTTSPTKATTSNNIKNN